MSIATKLAELTQIRTDIRTALAGKGISASDHDYADFSTDIESIPSGGGVIPHTYIANSYYQLKTDNGAFKTSTGNFRCLLQNSDLSDFKPLNTSGIQSYRVVIKFTFGGQKSDAQGLIGGATSEKGATVIVTPANKSIIELWYPTYLSINYNMVADSTYYVSYSVKSGTTLFNLYDENGNLLSTATKASSVLSNAQQIGLCGYLNSSSRWWSGLIDLSEMFFEVDNVVVWGATNSKTAIMGVIT